MKTVYSYYVLDLVHRGHITFMKNAKALAGKDGRLIVGILTDEATMEKKPKPLMPFKERMFLAEALKYADLVVPQETYSPIDNVKRLKPDILIESETHGEGEIKKVEKIMKDIGGTVKILPYFPEVSSTTIKDSIKDNKGEN